MKKLLLLFMLVYVGTVNAQESNKVYKNEISIDAFAPCAGQCWIIV